MSESRADPSIFWVDPEQRGVLPLDDFHISRSLRKTLRRKPFEIHCNTAFKSVIRKCAAEYEGRKETWINDEIVQAYTELHRLGFAHSVECWDAKGNLVGGLYGVSLGGAFCGESMFSETTDASKVALVHLVARLKRGGFQLLDTQFITDHLKQFGAQEIPARDYLQLLDAALSIKAEFVGDLDADEEDQLLEELFLQSSTQTS